MVFQANDRTLTDEEINALMEKIYITIKDNNWAVR
jgi:phenylalanyl-tRNA synthetase beta subunit